MLRQKVTQHYKSIETKDDIHKIEEENVEHMRFYSGSAINQLPTPTISFIPLFFAQVQTNYKNFKSRSQLKSEFSSTSKQNWVEDLSLLLLEEVCL